MDIHSATTFSQIDVVALRHILTYLSPEDVWTFRYFIQPVTVLSINDITHEINKRLCRVEVTSAYPYLSNIQRLSVTSEYDVSRLLPHCYVYPAKEIYINYKPHPIIKGDAQLGTATEDIVTLLHANVSKVHGYIQWNALWNVATSCLYKVTGIWLPGLNIYDGTWDVISDWFKQHRLPNVQLAYVTFPVGRVPHHVWAAITASCPRLHRLSEKTTLDLKSHIKHYVHTFTCLEYGLPELRRYELHNDVAGSYMCIERHANQRLPWDIEETLKMSKHVPRCPMWIVMYVAKHKEVETFYVTLRPTYIIPSQDRSCTSAYCIPYVQCLQ